jgi:hypothetical protein
VVAESGYTAEPASAQRPARGEGLLGRHHGGRYVRRCRSGRSMRLLLEDMGEDNVRTWVGPPVIAISGRLDATWRIVVHRIGCDSMNPDPKVACDAASD